MALVYDDILEQKYHDEFIVLCNYCTLKKKKIESGKGRKWLLLMSGRSKVHFLFRDSLPVTYIAGYLYPQRQERNGM